jgi:hypothetical protein
MRRSWALSASRPFIAPSQRGWTALLWGCVCFLGGELLLTAAMAHWRPDLGDPEYGSKLAALEKRLVEQPAGRPLLLVLGSSRAAMGIRPDVLPTSEGPLWFNFALVGSGPVMELSCLRRLLADGVHPDAVLVECWPPFWHQEEGYAEEKRWHPIRMGWSDLALLCAYSAQPDELSRCWWQAHTMPAFFNRLTLMSRFAPAWLPFQNRMDGNWTGLDEWGWLECPTRARDADSYCKRLEQAHGYYAPIFEQFRISAVTERAQRELLELCRRERIAVTLMLLPEGSAFRDWYPPEVRARSEAHLDRLCRDYGVRRIDARDWAPDDALLDGFHLMPDGAAAFTARLAEAVRCHADR